MPVTKYELKWTQQINDTCYHLLPIMNRSFVGVRFLELTARKIVATSHKIPCKDSAKLIYVKNIHNEFWQFSRPHGFKKIVPRN